MEQPGAIRHHIDCDCCEKLSPETLSIVTEMGTIVGSRKKEILETCQTSEELSIREVFWIEKMRSFDRSIGYNILTTPQFGNVISNHPKKEELCKARSIRFSGEGNPMWGKKHTKETLNKIKRES